MKRCMALVVALVMLGGCASAVPPQTEGAALPGNIQIRSLEARREFGGFSAGAPTGAEKAAQTLVESVLSEYPRSLLAQLGPVEVLLAGKLTGEGDFAQGSYAGFTQAVGEGWRMVLDVQACSAGTVHHELAHILDGILRAAGRLSEEEWMRLNPPIFQYGSGGWEGYEAFFVDAYAMENMLEDRAAVFEAAVMGGHGTFDGKSPLWLKLFAFCEAIRAHFDTDGWPTAAIWELALH